GYLGCVAGELGGGEGPGFDSRRVSGDRIGVKPGGCSCRGGWFAEAACDGVMLRRRESTAPECYSEGLMPGSLPYGRHDWHSVIITVTTDDGFDHRIGGHEGFTDPDLLHRGSAADPGDLLNQRG